LAHHAFELGVEVRQATTVTNLQGDLITGFKIEARSNSVSQSIHARAVIAAYGKRGILDRALNRRFLNHSQPFVALKAHFEGLHLPGLIELHTFPGGYCGMSEIEDGNANVCLLAHEGRFRAVTQNRHNAVAIFIEWIQSQNPALRQRLSRANRRSQHWLTIAQIPFGSKDVVEGDILAAGDAAGLIVPLVGDGIAMALRSGRLAAFHTANFLDGEYTPIELRQRYTQDWKCEFDRRLKLGRVLQAIMLRPRLLALGLRALNALPQLGDYLVRNTRDTLPGNAVRRLG
jgi:flavin-dependent dehydrogenase